MWLVLSGGSLTVERCVGVKSVCRQSNELQRRALSGSKFIVGPLIPAVQSMCQVESDSDGDVSVPQRSGASLDDLVLEGGASRWVEVTSQAPQFLFQTHVGPESFPAEPFLFPFPSGRPPNVSSSSGSAKARSRFRLLASKRGQSLNQCAAVCAALSSLQGAQTHA